MLKEAVKKLAIPFETAMTVSEIASPRMMKKRRIGDVDVTNGENIDGMDVGTDTPALQHPIISDSELEIKKNSISRDLELEQSKDDTINGFDLEVPKSVGSIYVPSLPAAKTYPVEWPPPNIPKKYRGRILLSILRTGSPLLPEIKMKKSKRRKKKLVLVWNKKSDNATKKKPKSDNESDKNAGNESNANYPIGRGGEAGASSDKESRKEKGPRKGTDPDEDAAEWEEGTYPLEKYKAILEEVAESYKDLGIFLRLVFGRTNHRIVYGTLCSSLIPEGQRSAIGEHNPHIVGYPTQGETEFVHFYDLYRGYWDSCCVSVVKSVESIIINLTDFKTAGVNAPDMIANIIKATELEAIEKSISDEPNIVDPSDMFIDPTDMVIAPANVVKSVEPNIVDTADEIEMLHTDAITGSHHEAEKDQTMTPVESKPVESNTNNPSDMAGSRSEAEGGHIVKQVEDEYFA